MEGGASRRVRGLKGIDLVDDGTGLKSEEKSMDGAMIVGDGGSPGSWVSGVLYGKV
jgi:hypothetical protein